MIYRIASKTYFLLIFTFISFTGNGQIKANFLATPISGCAPLVVSFKDQSTGNPTQWKWDLGNGTISYLQNPSVYYFNPGYYTVKLIVKNATQTDSIVKTQYIYVVAKPVVQFTANTIAGCNPLPVHFTDKSNSGSDSLTIWQWDFGDGFSSNQKNPMHIFTNSGYHNVTLRVINSNGCLNTISKNNYIEVFPIIKANFSNSVSSECNAPVSINFQNLSTGTSAKTFKWLFGDSTSSILENPVHVYNKSGKYTVKFIVTSASGCIDTIIKTDAITVGNFFTNFNTKTSVCTEIPLDISNNSNPTPASVVWDFGDGTTSTQINPDKIYNIPGNYLIKLTANFGSCLDTFSKMINVIGNSKAAFVADDTANCNYPFTVKFTNNTVNGSTYRWDFGDNTTSTLFNPTHTYNSYGNFDVVLIVTNANGCTDTLRKKNYIKIVKPVVFFTNLPAVGCEEFTKTFTNTAATLKPIISYLWDFGDGTTSSAAIPTHTYKSAGVYDVQIIITTAGGCADTTIQKNAITVLTRPVAKFSGGPRVACANKPIIFIDESTGNVKKWLWNFNDSVTSTLKNPERTFFDTGHFDVQLIVWNSGCSDTINYNNYIHIKAPLAQFIPLFDCSKPFQRIFKNVSIGADTWTWDFGDGIKSNQYSPEHTYTLPGMYTVSLYIVNNSTGCDYMYQKNINVYNTKSTFFASDTTICKGTNLAFTNNLNLAEIKQFNWNFGDGTSFTSTNNNTTHLYSKSGTYTVTLITTNVMGCNDTLTKLNYIRINGPTAKFQPAVTGSCLNSTITFNDQSIDDSIHAIQTWAWDYGDGTKETLFEPAFQHSYINAGVYHVFLKVTDNIGCIDSFSLPDAITISKPVADFITIDSISCPNKQIGFINQSTGPSLTYLWNFGDGNISTQQNPIHNYLTEGSYAVNLSIKDQYGCTDSIAKSSFIAIRKPVSKFTMNDSFSICPPLIVNFTNLSTNHISQKWDFGDGTSADLAEPSHFYNYPGLYTITLTVTGLGGCVDVSTKSILIRGPMGTFTYNPKEGCNPTTINFIAKTQENISFVWDFNDGNTLDTKDSIVSHIYKNAGIYLPKMILSNEEGCQVPIIGKDTIVINGVTPNFSFSDKALCDSGNVSFTNTSISNDVITSYQWFFGDGTISSEQYPKHTYNATGTYYPKLIINTLNGCKDSLQSSIPVKIVASPHIDILNSANGCTPLAVTFNGKIIVNDTSALSWNWNFMNGNTSTLQIPPVQNYTVSGIYNPTLEVTNSSGCKNYATKIIDAYVIPTINAGNDTTVCNKIGAALKATGGDSYNWSPAVGLSCTNCASPFALPDSAKTYIVKGTSLQGCTAYDTILVKVQYPFKIIYSNRDTLCKGQNIKLFASGTDNFQWSPTASLNNSNIALPIAIPDTTTKYRVIGTDKWSCFKDTGYVIIKVYPIPTVNAGADKKINIGQVIDLIPIISSDVTQVLWTPTGSIFRNTYPAISIKPNQNTDFTVEVKNGGGCTAKDIVSVFVICNGANVFVPNTFTPNGDGVNDIFYARGSGVFNIKTMRVFNRWGEIVFERNSINANDPTFGWDGTYKGVKLSADVFVYAIDIICDNNTILNYKGNIALVQ